MCILSITLTDEGVMLFGLTSVFLAGIKLMKWRRIERGGGGVAGEEEIPSGWLLLSREFNKVQWPSSWILERSISMFVCMHVTHLSCVCVWADCPLMYMPSCSSVCIYSRGCMCFREGNTHHEGWQVCTTNEATDWRLVFVAKLAPIYPLSLSQTSIPLFTLMDNMSYFPAMLGRCIIKCQITVNHHSEPKCIICGK